MDSPLQGAAVHDYDAAAQVLRCVREAAAKGQGFDPSGYVCARIAVQSHDGVQVPVTIVHKGETQL